MIENIADLFDELDTRPTEDVARNAVLVKIRQALNTTKFVQGLLRDARAD